MRRREGEAATETILTTWVISALEEVQSALGAQSSGPFILPLLEEFGKMHREGLFWLGLVGFEVGGGGKDAPCREEPVQRPGEGENLDVV